MYFLDDADAYASGGATLVPLWHAVAARGGVLVVATHQVDEIDQLVSVVPPTTYVYAHVRAGSRP